jgi:hypothetical protein
MDTRSFNIETGNQPETEPGRYETVGASVLRLAESLRQAFGDAEATQFLEAERLTQLGMAATASPEQARDAASSFAYLPPNTVQTPNPAKGINYGVNAQGA